VAPSRAVLFDLDGTLADTAPDLAAALNHLRTQHGMNALPVDAVRPYASMGARGLLRVGFGLDATDPGYLPMRNAFLDRYDERVCVESRLFPGMAEVLAELVQRRIAWGIVTNKATRFTERLVAELKLDPDCVACGDTTPHLKPHPASLLHAAHQIQVSPRDCFYLGDDLRDMKAAQAAGMRAIAVEWGYHHPESGGPDTWQAAAIIRHPLELIEHL
jgi:phosphoglycolate phosphatase